MQAHLHPRGLTLGLAELQAPVAPAVGRIAIAEQRGDLLPHRRLTTGFHRLNPLVLRFPPVGAAGKPVAGGELRVEGIGPRHQLQPGQRQPVASAESLLPVSFTGPAVLGGKHQHEGRAVPKDEQVRRGEEHPQVRAAAINIGQHRLQGGWEVQPAATAEHAGIGAQGVAEEARGASGGQPALIGTLRLPFPLGQIHLPPAAAVGGGKQVPAVGGDLQGGLQTGQGWVVGPGGIECSRP